MFNERFRNEYSEKILQMVELFIEEQIPFNIQIINNNNWNKSLPEGMLNNPDFEEYLFLSIINYSLESSFVDETTGEIILTVAFGEDVFQKILLSREIVGIYSLDGKVLLGKPYKEEKIKNSIIDKNDNVEIQKSMEMFKKNNPNFFKNK